MRVLLIDHFMDSSVEFAQRLSKDGHEVIYSGIWGPKSESPFMSALGKGLRNVTVDPEAWMNYIGKVDVATISGSGYRGHLVRYLRNLGVPVVGPGPWGCKIEQDRAFGREVFAEMGMRPPKSWTFDSTEEVAEFIKKNRRKYIFKVDQTARNATETVVGQDPEGTDLIDLMYRLDVKLPYAEGNMKFYLEELLEGIEVGIDGIFNGREVVGSLLVCYEGDAGYAYDLSLDGDKLVDREAIARVLSAHKYRGPFAINGFWTNEGYRTIEWTPRWGSGTTEFFCHAPTDLGELLLAVATGKKLDGDIFDPVLKGKTVIIVKATDFGADPQAAVPIRVPKGKDLPIFDIKTGSYWACFPTKSEDGQWMSLPLPEDHTICSGMYVGVGGSLREAFEQVDALADEVGVAGAAPETGSAREDLEKKFGKIRRRFASPDWIRTLADETRHLWGRPLRRS